MLQGKTLGTGRLQVPGKHNVLNALAALIVADHQGIPFKKAAAAAARYRGTRRRFQIRSDRDGVAMIDDYAHHPTAIQATLQAARERYPDRALWAVWQPHTFSRTQQFWERYLTSFIAADHVLITDIYAARETPVPGVSAQGLVAAMNHADVRHTPTFKEAVLALETGVEAPAAIIIMSAGDAPKIGRIYLKRRSKREDR
jgi:UDP-N-acetylmuramate--alanine ligase